MKILLAYYRYSPNINGPSTYIDILREELKKNGHHVDLLSHDEQWVNIQIGEKQKADKISIKKSLVDQYIFSYSKKYHPWIFWREMERYCLERAAMKLDLNEYDLIHCQDFMMARALSRTKPSHIPLIISLHNCKHHEAIITGEYHSKTSQEKQFIKAEEFLGSISGDTTIVPSLWLKEKLTDIGVPSENIQVLPYGILSEKFIGKEIANRNPSDKKIILCPARLVPIKGHRFLFEALQKLTNERDDFHCLLAGDGTHHEELNDLTIKLGIQSFVTFLGRREDIPYLMSSSDIIVLPSLHDTFPIVLLEGQMSKKPIISTNVGGIPEIIKNGENGLLVPPANSKALEEKLRLLLNDHNLRQQLSERAQKFALQHWTIKEHFKCILNLYNKIQKTNSINNSSPKTVKWHPDKKLLNQIKSQNKSVESGMTYKDEVPENLKGKLAEKQHYVHLFDLSGVVLQTAKIDLQGNYSFEFIPRGDYVLKSTILGFGNKQLSL
ncbi:glycosyltransferase family 4 protein [Bacillus sp. V2I10]|uniref:glycosyltransferase family 4 protein n=1 Tax=Bacillus sp. V2I10 TaxID=3042276 RepID=UPI0027D8B5D8|nr:glycosyltransferase family 4 protein [Bacillus sp. V2I10]